MPTRPLTALGRIGESEDRRGLAFCLRIFIQTSFRWIRHERLFSVIDAASIQCYDSENDRWPQWWIVAVLKDLEFICMRWNS